MKLPRQPGSEKGAFIIISPLKTRFWKPLVSRNYEQPLEIAKNLAAQTQVSPFTRMAMIFQACRRSSTEFRSQKAPAHMSGAQETAFLHQKYISHLIAELKPVLAKIITQGIQDGQIHFDYPEALAEIVLIILTVKLDNTLVPSSQEETEETMRGLITLLEKGTENPSGSLNFLLTL